MRENTHALTIRTDVTVTQAAHVTRDSDTTFKVKRSKVNLQGRGNIVADSRTLRIARLPAQLIVIISIIIIIIIQNSVTIKSILSLLSPFINSYEQCYIS